MSPQQHSQEENLAPAIVRARYDQLTIYEISESELETLERGRPESTYLSCAIALLSTALSFFASILTVKIESIYVFVVFTIIVILSFVLGTVLLLIWYRDHKSVSVVSENIRRRLPPIGDQAKCDDAS